MNPTREGMFEIPFSCREETRISPRYVWNNAARGNDPFVILQYTLQGEGRFEMDGTVHRVPAGCAFIALVPEKSRYFYPAEGRVRSAKPAPWTFAWVNLTGELALRLWRDLRDEAGPVVALKGATARLLLRLARQGEEARPGDWFATSRDVYRLYLEMRRQLPAKPSGGPVQEVADYFRSHYPKTIRMKEAADRVGLSREHFSRLFTAEMEEAPASYLRRLRLEAAARLLRTTDLPRREIAFRTGWPSARKLELFFRRAYGMGLEGYRGRKTAGGYPKSKRGPRRTSFGPTG